MKTFRTTGTGNEQTLSEIESDKIPIYPSVQDIEDDLANLEEGQIVATPDTGNEVAQPVDVVEKDNLHAVTSNAVSESLSYSTTEQKTGGVWIDGKPIYRKCYKLAQDVTTSSSGSVIALDILNPYYTSYSGDVNEITKLEYSPKAGQAFFPYLTFYLDTSRQYIGIKSDGSSLTIKKDSVFIIEYTKTTD